MVRAGKALLIVASLAFVVSGLAYALQPSMPFSTTIRVAPNEGLDELLQIAATVPDLVTQVLRPRAPAMVALLVTGWVALLYHSFSQLGPSGRSPSPDGTGRDYRLLVVGLSAGAVWPWLLSQQPGGAFLLGGLMMACILGETLDAKRDEATDQQVSVRATPRPAYSTSLSFLAGWVTLAGCALFATLLQRQFAASGHVAAVVGITVAALATVSIQLRLGRTISYGIAVIWGMIGLAAGSIATQAAMSMMAVLAIAIIAVAMVRVTT